MSKKKNKDRFRPNRFSWLEFIVAFITMCLLGALPALMFGADIVKESGIYFVWYILFMVVVAFLFCLFMIYQKHRTFNKPLKKISEAAGKVAKGDFSIYLKSEHTMDKRNYIDIMYEDFNKMVAELGSIETLKNDFVANVSHEIKSPLTVIQSYAVALQEPNISQDKRKEYTDTIILYTKKLTSLVTNILKLNKIENQIVPLNIENYDLCRQLCECAISFESNWEKKSIEFLAEIEDVAMINADKSMLEIVWHNLLSNALKFTENGGKIMLTQTSESESVTVTIKDTGCGMSEETLKHVFDKFYQGDTSHSGEGNGLGLALTLRAVEMAEGTITIKSELGKGSEFTVRLPLKLK